MEKWSSLIATVFPTDTLLAALRTMERHQVRLLGVVGDGGGLVGVVSEEHILAAWRGDPLAPVAGVMARAGAPGASRYPARRLRFRVPRRRELGLGEEGAGRK
ncbi:CBS domain-containing protein [Myxococcus sp. Y35]|uniref:CBS domain-containing protein n=1 Tax=Pseudomyxococcus flavus TaxID=3115648 RepID=UPI003CE7E87F